MIRAFGRYAGWNVLVFFMRHPGAQFHLKELARQVGISASTTKSVCDDLLKDGLLLVEWKGNLRLFSLNNSSVYVRQLKRALILILLEKQGMEKVTRSGSLALYGSLATGDYTEESDTDLLVIGEQKNVDWVGVEKLEKQSGRGVQVIVISAGRWEQLKRKGDAFAREVLAAHILLKGVPL